MTTNGDACTCSATYGPNEPLVLDRTRCPIHAPTARRFVICGDCGYHMRPDQTVDGLCINAARCNGRIQRRLRDKAAAGKRRR